MTIESMINPVDESEMLVAKGVVETITFKEIAGGPDKYGNTHRASVKVGEDWVNNINLKVNADYGPQIRYNAGNKAKPDYQTLEKGDEVRMIVTANEYNNKTYYNGSTSKIKLTKKGAGAPAQKPAQAGSTVPASSGSGWKKDTTGVEVGHALTIASQILGDVSDADAVLDLAKDIHVASIKLKAWYKDQNKGLSDYDIGATSGQAMKLVAKASMSVNDVVSGAKKFLTEVVPALTTYVKGEEPEQIKPEPKVQTKPSGKSIPNTTKNSVPKPEQQVVSGDDFGFDGDDAIPFNSVVGLINRQQRYTVIRGDVW